MLTTLHLTRFKNRENAYRVLSDILWERKFKKQSTVAVMRGGKMSEEKYLQALEEVKLLKK